MGERGAVNNPKRFIACSVSLAFAALLFFLPSLLCLPLVAPRVLAWGGLRLPGTLEAQSCSLGWRQGLRCENFRYNDPALGLQLHAPNLASDKGLLALLLAPSYLGEITVDQPTLVVLAPQTGSGSDRAGASTASGAEPWWERWTLRLEVNQGRVVDQSAPSGRELARNIEFSGSLAMGSVNYAIEGNAGQGTGHLRAQGFVNLPVAGQPLLAALISRADVEIRDLELADFLELAAARGNTPRGEGVLNAACRLNASGVDELAVEGDASLRDLQLAGGFLGEDRPSLAQLQFSFKGSRRADEWRLATLDLNTPPLRFTASGSLDRHAATLAAKGSIDLPTLAAQLPHLLALHQQTKVKQGAVDFSLQAEGAPADLRLQADCRTERLEVVHGGRELAWDTPLALSAEAGVVDGAATLHSLRVHAPFFDANGSGGAEAFTLRATADLGRMADQLDKIFAFDFHPRGQAEFAAASRQDDQGDYRLEMRLAVDDLALSQRQTVLLPAHPFSLNAEAVGLPSFYQNGGLRSLRFAGSGWLGNLEWQGSDLQETSSSGESDLAESATAAANCALKGTVDLTQLSAVRSTLAASPPPFALQGRLSFDGSGQWHGSRVTLDALTGGVDHLVVATPAGVLAQAPRATIALDGSNLLSAAGLKVGELKVAENWRDLQELEKSFISVDFAKRRLALRHLRCTTADAVVDAGFVVDDWRLPSSARAVEIQSDSKASLPANLCKAKGWLANEAELKGRARATFSSRVLGQERSSELAVVMEPFELRLAQKKIFADPRLQLKVSLASDRQGNGGVKIPAFSLQTRPLRLEGTGLIRDNVSHAAAPLLELQGSLAPDYPALVPLLAPFVGRETVLSGKEPGTFLLSAPLRLPMDMEQVTLAAQMPLDALRIFGLTLRQIPLAVELNRGRMRAQIAAPLGDGKLVLQPQWQREGQQTVLTLPAASQVLLDAPLQPAMVAGLLGPLHPLFGILAVPQGTVDLRVETLTLPLTGKGPAQPTFKAVLNVGNIRFKPVGALQAVLEVAGLPSGELRCKERELACEAKNGRMNCAPVRLLAGDQDIVMRGVTEANGTLDYRVQMPLTEALAQQAQLSVLGDPTVEAEIAGTRSAPLFDQPAFLASLAARVAAAATATVDEPSETGNEPKIPVIEE